MNSEKLRALEVRAKNDGWYLVTFYQFNKEDDNHPDYFDDWCEAVNGEWDYGGYKERCYVCFIKKKE